MFFHSNPGDKPYVYVYSSGDEQRTYHPINSCLQDIARGLKSTMSTTDGIKPWEVYLREGLTHLQARTDNDFTRPSANSDKLYMNIGNRDVIEVAHPVPTTPDTVDGPLSGNRIHLGPIGSGKDLVRSDTSRIEFARRYGLLATDLEMSSVLDSITGNCRDSFIVVKGIYTSDKLHKLSFSNDFPYFQAYPTTRTAHRHENGKTTRHLPLPLL